MHKLIVVGSGIKSVAHLTEETKKIIQNSDKVLYLVNEEFLKQWIVRESKNAESLEPIYFNSTKRVDAYANITSEIVHYIVLQRCGLD
jgi:precorrin-6B methylase 1